MKGIIFDEFIKLVESTFGEEILDQIINDNFDKLETGGAYTTVGTYNYLELLALVTSLSKSVDMPIADLVKAFGLHLASAFSTKFPHFYQECPNSFSLFKRIDDHIHVEVHKLYPDADLPRFSYEQISETELELTYQSKHDFSQLALGLIEGTAKYYNEDLNIKTKNLSSEPETKIIFNLKYQ